METTFLPASALIDFTVHTISADVDASRAAINLALRASIAAKGVTDAVLLDIDTLRNQAKIANGNHRIAIAYAINSDMLIPVNIRRGVPKRPMANAKNI